MLRASFDLPPEEAVAFFQAKGLLTSHAWQDVWASEHEAAFTVAKMADLDLLGDVREAVDMAIAEGRTLDQFRQAMIPRMIQAGWWGKQEQADPVTGAREMVQLGSARRIDTIFHTNMMTSYAAGEWAQIEDTAEDAPYLLYDAVDDRRVRPEHRAWDGTLLRWDDPWWQTHRPANGWRCRCCTIQLSARDVEAMGLTINATAPPVRMRTWLNRRTGEDMQVPVGIDPGFDYNPGQTRQAHLHQQLVERQQALR